MAQRTYRDANGYKKKKRPRKGSKAHTPQFSTIEEIQEHTRKKKIAGAKKHPNSKLAGPHLDKGAGLVALEGLSERVEQYTAPNVTLEEFSTGATLNYLSMDGNPVQAQINHKNKFGFKQLIIRNASGETLHDQLAFDVPSLYHQLTTVVRRRSTGSTEGIYW